MDLFVLSFRLLLTLLKQLRKNGGLLRNPPPSLKKAGRGGDLSGLIFLLFVSFSCFLPVCTCLAAAAVVVAVAAVAAAVAVWCWALLFLL